MALRLSEYADQDGVGLAALVRSGQVSATELMEAALAGIERLNPQLNAVTHTMRREAEAMIADGLPDGPCGGGHLEPLICERLYIPLESRAL
jgi:amidase